MFIFIGIGTFLTSWGNGTLEDWLWSPQRASLVVEQLVADRSDAKAQRFKVVVTWFENDYFGEARQQVIRSFVGIQGIDVVGTYVQLGNSAGGAIWRENVRTEGAEFLKSWNADMLILGVVRSPHEAITLWFLPRLGADSFSEGDKPYLLQHGTLPDLFHEHLRLQVLAWAFNAMGLTYIG